MAAVDASDRTLIEQARDRARLLLGGVGGDLDALRAAASDAAYADGAAVCEEVAQAVAQLIEHLDVELAAPVEINTAEINTASENPAP
jgi:predicted LPLAT superfamily acyltransferase